MDYRSYSRDFFSFIRVGEGKRQGREVEGGRMVRPKRWRLVEVAKALWTVLNRSSAHRKRVRLIMDTIANLSLFLEMIVYIQE